ncbi:MAG: MFS transporter [Acidobacteriota bacterium]
MSRGSDDETKRLELSKLWVLMVTAFVDMIGFALIVPLLPYYALEFGASATTIGFLMAIFAFGQMTTAPLWGRLSDRIGRKPVLMASQGLSAVAFVVFAFADAVWLLFLCRFLQGVGSGTLGAVSAYVTDAVGPDERAKALGWITACTSAGVMVGPAIGSLTVGWSSAAPGLIAAGLCGVNLVFTSIFLGEARAVDRDKPRPKSRRLLGEIGQVLARPAVPVHSLIWVYTAGMMAFMSMTGIMALYLEAVFGIDKERIGYFYVAIGAVSVVMRGLILGRMVDAFGEVRTLRLGALCLGLGMLGLTVPTTVPAFVVVMLMVPTGTALLFPSTTSLVTRYADPDHVGQTVGVQQAFGGVSRLLAPIWAGAVFEVVGIREPFWIGGTLVLLTFLFALRLRPGEAPSRRRARMAAEAAARAEAESPTEV